MKTKFKEGDRIYKARAYSDKKYVRFGGTIQELPLKTKGTIMHIYFEGEIEAMFDNDKHWNVDSSELELCNNNPLLADLEVPCDIKQDFGSPCGGLMDFLNKK